LGLLQLGLQVTTMVVRLGFVTMLLLLSSFPAVFATDYIYSVRRGKSSEHAHSSLPSRTAMEGRQEGREALGPERRGWQFQPHSITVSAVVKERMANTKVTFSSDPIDASKTAEITMRIPENAYVNFLEMKIGDQTYVGGVKEREKAREEFEDAKNAGESASLVESRGSSFTILITLEAGEAATVTVGYEEYLALYLGSYDFHLALDTSADPDSRLLPTVLVDIRVEESEGLQSIAVPKPNFDCAYQATTAGNNFRTCGLSGSTDRAWIKFESLNLALIMLNPTQQDQKTASWGGSGTGLALDLVVRITPLATFARDAADGGVMMIDAESGHFVHVFSAPQTPSMPKAVVLMMDTSGSMSESAGGRSRMQQAQVRREGGRARERE
jgi:hypothetical protein